MIADRVRDLRRRAGLSQDDLAERMSDLGLPWKRTTVVNLETRATGSRGQGAGRDTVTAGELLALARVLDVPPVWLLADPAGDLDVPITRDLSADPWSALLWMVGKAPLGEETGSWSDAARPLDEVCRVVQVLDQLRQLANLRHLSTVITFDDETTLAEQDEPDMLARERQLLGALVRPLERLVKWGYRVPPLPDDLSARAVELGVELPTVNG